MPPCWGDEHQCATYFDVHQGYRVLTQPYPAVLWGYQLKVGRPNSRFLLASWFERERGNLKRKTALLVPPPIFLREVRCLPKAVASADPSIPFLVLEGLGVKVAKVGMNRNGVPLKDTTRDAFFFSRNPPHLPIEPASKKTLGVRLRSPGTPWPWTFDCFGCL